MIKALYSRLKNRLRRTLTTPLPPPQRYYETTASWMATQSSSASGSAPTLIPIHPRLPFERQPPPTVETRMNWRFAGPNLPRQATEPTFVAHLHQGHIWGDSGAVITPDNALLWDLVADQRLGPEHHPIFQQPVLPPTVSLQGRVANLSGDSPENYHHWLIEILPRLELIRLAGWRFDQIDFFIFNPLTQPYQPVTLERLGIPLRKVLIATATTHYQCSELILPSFARGSGCGIPWIVQFLRRVFLPSLPADNQRLRLYISRASARIRRVTNELEVMDLLASYGFQAVRLEELNFEQQVQLFAQAEVVVGPHGAGLTNIVFAPPGTTVIEFTMPDRVHYWGLACANQLDYYYVNGFPELPETFTDFTWEFNDDMTVNLETLQRTLEYAGVEARP